MGLLIGKNGVLEFWSIFLIATKKPTFEFESFLGKIKPMVRKEGKSIKQAIQENKVDLQKQSNINLKFSQELALNF